MVNSRKAYNLANDCRKHSTRCSSVGSYPGWFSPMKLSMGRLHAQMGSFDDTSTRIKPRMRGKTFIRRRPRLRENLLLHPLAVNLVCGENTSTRSKPRLRGNPSPTVNLICGEDREPAVYLTNAGSTPNYLMHGTQDSSVFSCA